jgi:Ca2+-binding EF-hand superfamily protein
MAAAKKDLLQRVDANGDGKLDCQEFIDLFEQLFQDANKPLDALVS